MIEEFDYSIIVPTKNPGLKASELISAVESQKIGSSIYELIVVDSDSRDGSRQSFRGAGASVVPILPASFRHGRARNIGASLAKAPILVFLTQDAIPADDKWLLTLTRPLAKDEIAGTYSRQIPRPNASPTEKAFLLDMYPPTSRWGRSEKPLGIGDVHFSNVSSSVKRCIWREIQFSEEIIMGEDQLWALEAVRKGFLVQYVPESRVIHSNSLRLPDLFRRYFDSGISYADIYDESPLHKNLSAEFIIRGAKHLARQCRLLRQMKESIWIPHALLEDAAKLVAIWLGSKYRLLPEDISRTLSWHKHYFFRTLGLEQFP